MPGRAGRKWHHRTVRRERGGRRPAGELADEARRLAVDLADSREHDREISQEALQKVRDLSTKGPQRRAKRLHQLIDEATLRMRALYREGKGRAIDVSEAGQAPADELADKAREAARRGADEAAARTAEQADQLSRQGQKL
jgi:hypothetical protein